ncbi:hypothetical protein RHMOL_Rhmol06G0142200 [Rhododendron molle]|uniref:Uncharacterized protein n=1 Tax=Rhododendron molle TaxID=49168 RepID=A0ACC0NCB5_RHOML|nr:hypothetical protein RHMOL_Rhmol06G0142200 [Rhododendron molle]
MSGGDGEQERQQGSAGGEKPRAVEVEDRARQTHGVMEPSVEPLGTGMAASDSEQTRSGSGEDANGDDRRALEPDTCAREPVGVVGPRADPMGPSSIVEGTSAVGGSSDVISSNGTQGNDTEPIESPPRDPVKGKGIVGTEEVHIEEHAEEVPIEREQTTEAAPAEVWEEDIAFRPPAGAARSSRHMPITYDDIAEHTPDGLLAKLLADHPIIGEYVLKAKEDRARAIEASEAAARAEREAERERAGSEGLATDIEAEERDAEEAQGPRVSAVTEAGALKRPEFSEETYMPPRPHLFVPSGFAGYKPPQQADYDLELVLRDPGVHIANTWAEVYHLITPFTL